MRSSWERNWEATKNTKLGKHKFLSNSFIFSSPFLPSFISTRSKDSSKSSFTNFLPVSSRHFIKVYLRNFIQTAFHSHSNKMASTSFCQFFPILRGSMMKIWCKKKKAQQKTKHFQKSNYKVLSLEIILSRSSTKTLWTSYETVLNLTSFNFFLTV